MDEARFDAWTRRRFGLGAGGLAASLLGVLGVNDTEGEGKGRRGERAGARKNLHRQGMIFTMPSTRSTRSTRRINARRPAPGVTQTTRRTRVALVSTARRSPDLVGSDAAVKTTFPALVTRSAAADSVSRAPAG